MGKQKKKRRSEWAMKAAITPALLNLNAELVKLVTQLLER